MSVRGKSYSLAVRSDGVAVLTFDTPGSPVNVLSREVLAEVEELFARVESDPSIRAAVLASGKRDSFVAGADLDQVLAMESAEEGAAFSRNGHRILDRVERCGKPVVAAVHGAALGGGRLGAWPPLARCLHPSRAPAACGWVTHVSMCHAGGQIACGVCSD